MNVSITWHQRSYTATPIDTDKLALGGTGVVAWERICPPVTCSFEAWSKCAELHSLLDVVGILERDGDEPGPDELWTADEIDGDKSGTNPRVHPNVEYVRISFVDQEDLASGSTLGNRERWNEEGFGTDRHDKPAIIKFWTAFV